MAKWRCDHPWICLHTSPWWLMAKINGVVIFLGFVCIQVHGGPPPPRNGKHGAAQVECQPEVHRDSNRLVIEGKVAQCNWHCHRPIRRVKAGCSFQPGPADQIISPEADLGVSLSTTGRSLALFLKKGIE